MPSHSTAPVSNRPPAPGLRPISDPIGSQATLKAGPFSSLRFKSRRGVPGLFKPDKDEPPATGTLSKASSKPPVSSTSKGSETGSVRGLWDRIKKSGFGSTAVRDKAPRPSLAAETFARPTTRDFLPDSLSHAPPFPVSPPAATVKTSKAASNAPRSLSSIFPAAAPVKAASTSTTRPAPIRSTARAPLGNVFLGPLSDDDPTSPGKMVAARAPEMSGEGMDFLVQTGADSVRRRREGPAPVVRRSPTIETKVPEVKPAERQATISVVSRANKTLLELVARLELSNSATSTPTSSPRSAHAGSPLSIVSSVASSPSPAQRTSTLHKPSVRRIKPKASALGRLPSPPEESVDDLSLALTAALRDLGNGGTGGTASPPPAAASQRYSTLSVLSDVPDDLQTIISDGSVDHWSSPPSSPDRSALGLPPAPPANRISPPRHANLGAPAVSFGRTLGQSLYDAGSSDDDDDSTPSPAARDSATFDWTGEIGRLNEGIRASFVERRDAVPQKAAASGSPLGALNKAFKFGAPSTLQVPSDPQPPRRAPTLVLRAPTPSLSSQLHLPLPSDRSFLDLNGSSDYKSSVDTADVDGRLFDSAFDTDRFSMVSDDTEKKEQRRQGTHRRGGGHNVGQDSVFSFASISSLGNIINGGSPDPFSLDFSPYRDGQADVSHAQGHNRTFSTDSAASSFSFHAPRTHHRRTSSISSIVSVGGSGAVPIAPPVSLWNKGHGREVSTGGQSFKSTRSSGGRPDWARHRKQRSSMDSQASSMYARGASRPGLGDRMFASEIGAGAPLFSIAASPTVSEDESYLCDTLGNGHARHASAGLESLTSDSDNGARTSLDIDSSYRPHISIRNHHRRDSSDSSVFGLGDDSMDRSFMLKPLRPLSRLSTSSSDDGGGPGDDDTFAWRADAEEHRKPQVLSLHPSSTSLAVPREARRRPVSVVSSTGSIVDFNDTFEFLGLPPAPFVLPSLDARDRSPLRIKRKAVPKVDEESSPRKARLVDHAAAAAKRSGIFARRSKGVEPRPSLEDSCLTGQGEDSSFSSQDTSLASPRDHDLSSRKARSRPRAPVRSKNGSARQRPASLALETITADLLPALVAVQQPPSPRGLGHRRKASGAVTVQETILEETAVPALSHSPNTPGSLDHESQPSPLFLRGREPDVVTLDEEPYTMEALRGYSEWERDAYLEHGLSQRLWLDTDYSRAEMLNFSPPRKLVDIGTFVTLSKRHFVPLSPSHLKHRRSSSLHESRAGASPYAAPAQQVTSRLPVKSKAARPAAPLASKFHGGSTDPAQIAQFLAASGPPSAKFAQFAVPRPLSPLVLAVQPANDQPVEVASPVKTAKRVSSGNTRRAKLGWTRKRMSDVPTSTEPVKVVEIKRSSLQESSGTRLQDKENLGQMRPLRVGSRVPRPITSQPANIRV